ncbi:MAG: hypothetical protein ACD_50C00281G0003 [uncultured bacterium]|nr:MAG: hypothetical protein ACD_50C00281G0003 [uncultured bacterium]OGH14757.1 MAG: hypothetical protein A2687_02805 [Candidatus Levybacteria bacterium RIFCSPHIGHO2_01_FULL_38_26]
MRIKKHKKYSKEDLIERMRKITLLHSTGSKNSVYVYKNANIEVDYIAVSKIVPSQFYYLEKVLSKIGEVEKALRNLKIDLFDLEGHISYQTNESDYRFSLLPVIVEYQREEDGTISPMILDGLHRVLLARKKNLKKIKAVKISNVDLEHPVFGHPNPGGWEDVKSVKTVPDKKNKRLWRFPVDEAYKYYRDFNSAFGNVGKPRK